MNAPDAMGVIERALACLEDPADQTLVWAWLLTKALIDSPFRGAITIGARGSSPVPPFLPLPPAPPFVPAAPPPPSYPNPLEPWARPVWYVDAPFWTGGFGSGIPTGT